MPLDFLNEMMPLGHNFGGYLQSNLEGTAHVLMMSVFIMEYNALLKRFSWTVPYLARIPESSRDDLGELLILDTFMKLPLFSTRFDKDESHRGDFVITFYR